jgi:hypothetical protein
LASGRLAYLCQVDDVDAPAVSALVAFDLEPVRLQPLLERRIGFLGPNREDAARAERGAGPL